MEHRDLTVFAVGGSGIRTVQSLLHLCAFGLGPRTLSLVMIDPDQSNAAVGDTMQLLKKYSRARELLADRAAPEGYFRTEVRDAREGRSVWSPLGNDADSATDRFDKHVGGPSMRSADTRSLGLLYEMLFGEQFREMDLGMGFRGVPAIGTVFMNRLREETFFHQLLNESRQTGDSLFCAVGTIFGGTGAAALPVVARALNDGVPAGGGGVAIPGISRRRIAGIVLLPYFTLPTPDSPEAPDGGPRPQGSIFAQNAAAALPTYFDEHSGYGAIYAIGDNEPRQQAVNEVGGEEQRNDPHYVELFAALAALDFTARGGENSTNGPTFRIAAVNDRDVVWRDLPIDNTSLRRLMGGVVAMLTHLRVFRPDGDATATLTKEFKGATFLQLLGLDADVFRLRSSSFDAMAEFYMETWSWLEALRSSSPSLRLAQLDGRRPTQVRFDEIFDHPSQVGDRMIKDDFEVFRHWNMAATRVRGGGFGGLMRVMREGSESFIAARLPQITPPGEQT